MVLLLLIIVIVIFCLCIKLSLQLASHRLRLIYFVVLASNGRQFDFFHWVCRRAGVWAFRLLNLIVRPWLYPVLAFRRGVLLRWQLSKLHIFLDLSNNCLLRFSLTFSLAAQVSFCIFHVRVLAIADIKIFLLGLLLLHRLLLRRLHLLLIWLVLTIVALDDNFLGLPFALCLAPQVALSFLHVDFLIADLQIVLLIPLLSLVRIDCFVELLSRLLRLEDVR